MTSHFTEIHNEFHTEKYYGDCIWIDACWIEEEGCQSHGRITAYCHEKFFLSRDFVVREEIERVSKSIPKIVSKEMLLEIHLLPL